MDLHKDSKPVLDKRAKATQLSKDNLSINGFSNTKKKCNLNTDIAAFAKN